MRVWGSLTVLILLSCNLYEDQLFSFNLQLPPAGVFTTVDPQIPYTLGRGMNADIQVERLTDQQTWVVEGSLSVRLSGPSGTLRWSVPLQNTDYRLTARPLTFRSGTSLVLDEPRREYLLRICLQSLHVQGVSLVSVQKNNSNWPLQAVVQVQAKGLRPGAALLLIDTSHFLWTPPYVTNHPITSTPVAYVYGFGKKVQDLGLGLELWEFLVPFDCHSPGTYLINGFNAFSPGDSIYVAVHNLGSVDYWLQENLGQNAPPIGTPLTSWFTVTWP